MLIARDDVMLTTRLVVHVQPVIMLSIWVSILLDTLAC